MSSFFPLFKLWTRNGATRFVNLLCKIMKYSDFLLQNVRKRPESCRTCRGWTVNLPGGFLCLPGTSQATPGGCGRRESSTLRGTRAKSPAEPLPGPVGSYSILAIGRGHRGFSDHKIFSVFMVPVGKSWFYF